MQLSMLFTSPNRPPEGGLNWQKQSWREKLAVWPSHVPFRGVVLQSTWIPLRTGCRGATTGEQILISGRESGVALLITMFIIAVTSILALSLTRSTYLAQRMHQVSEQRLKAEFLLKSSLSVARIIISQEPPEEGAQPPWQAFSQGLAFPGTHFRIPDPQLRIALEIKPEESKIPLRWLQNPSSSFFKRQRDIIYQLFQNLGFDETQPSAGDQSGSGSVRFYNSRDLVSNLIDYMDADEVPYQEDGFSGNEGQSDLPVFPNRPLERIEEISQIPGFTPQRLRLLTPHVSAADFQMINVNFATREVLRAVDPSLTDQEVTVIIETAQGPNGPLTSENIERFIPNFSNLSSFLNFRSLLLQVIVKIEVGGNRYFLKALVRKMSDKKGELPTVQTQQLFG
jgi:type II secretory pathway component PulK